MSKEINMDHQLKLIRNSDEKEAVVKCFIFPSLCQIHNDNLVWSNNHYENRYKNAKESTNCREFNVIDCNTENEIGCCVLNHIDYENQNIHLSSRIYLKDNELPVINIFKLFIDTVENFIFDHFDVIKIFGCVDADHPYLSVFEELNYQQEGCLQENFYKKGKYIDQYIYSKFLKR
jgi:RimJ/RimL family protein N-acetyltransferase